MLRVANTPTTYTWYQAAKALGICHLTVQSHCEDTIAEMNGKSRMEGRYDINNATLYKLCARVAEVKKNFQVCCLIGYCTFYKRPYPPESAQYIHYDQTDSSRNKRAINLAYSAKDAPTMEEPAIIRYAPLSLPAFDEVVTMLTEAYGHEKCDRVFYCCYTTHKE